MDREQIITAWECCASPEYKCEECPIDKQKKDDCICGQFLAQTSLEYFKSQEQRIGELAEEKENLKIMNELCEISEQSLRDLYDADTTAQSEVISRLIEENEKLTEENERLKSVEFTCGFIKPHKVLECPIFDEIVRTKADTVRKMHSEIKKRCIEGGIYPAFVASTIDQIAKEMLEGDNEN